MTSPVELYSELLSLTKRYFAQEYAPSDKIFSEPETYGFFKAFAAKRADAKDQSPGKIPQAASPQPAVQMHPPSPSFAPKQKTDDKAVGQRLKTVLEPAPALQINHPIAKATQPPENQVPKAKQEALFFVPELPPAIKSVDFSDLRKIFVEKLPHIRLIDQIPDDLKAKSVANAWTRERMKPQVMILAFDEAPKHLAFLANIAKALEACGSSAEVVNAVKIERGNEWKELLKSQELKLVIASSPGFYHLPELQKQYRQGTRQEVHYLGDRLLMLMSDIGFYFKEPALKSSLWAALKQLLATPSPAA